MKIKNIFRKIFFLLIILNSTQNGRKPIAANCSSRSSCCICANRHEKNLKKEPPYTLEEFKELLELFSNPHTRLFLALIAFAEGTKQIKKDYSRLIINPTPLIEYQRGFLCYINTDFIKHPNKNRRLLTKNFKVLNSTASGRYQIIKDTDDLHEYFFSNSPEMVQNPEIDNLLTDIYLKINFYYQSGKTIYPEKEDLIKQKFGPFWQDMKALSLLKKAKVSTLLKRKITPEELTHIIFALAKVWASFPTAKGKSNYANQRCQSIKDLVHAYHHFKKNSIRDFIEDHNLKELEEL